MGRKPLTSSFDELTLHLSDLHFLHVHSRATLRRVLQRRLQSSSQFPPPPIQPPPQVSRRLPVLSPPPPPPHLDDSFPLPKASASQLEGPRPLTPPPPPPRPFSQVKPFPNKPSPWNPQQQIPTKRSPLPPTYPRGSPLGLSQRAHMIDLGVVSTAMSGGLDSSDVNTILSVHNSIRANFQAPPLTWSNQLAVGAQTW